MMSSFTKFTAVLDEEKYEVLLGNEPMVLHEKRKRWGFTRMLPNAISSSNIHFYVNGHQHKSQTKQVMEEYLAVEEVEENLQQTEVDKRRYNLLHRIATAAVSKGLEISYLPRLDRKLLILNIDGIIYDRRLLHKPRDRLTARPHFYQLLEEVYVFYDIGFWLDCSMSRVKERIGLMNIGDSCKYRILFYASNKATEMVDRPMGNRVQTKPLRNIFKHFPMYNYSNTIMCDDNIDNFECNPQNGILVSKFTYSRKSEDNELLQLMEYLKRIACEPTFFLIDHSKWKSKAEFVDTDSSSDSS